MSRKTTRHLVADYLTAHKPAGVGTVFASPPKVARTGDALAGLPAGTPSGSVVYVEILRSQELRVGVGGPTAGKKTVVHDLRLHLLFRSVRPKAEDAMDDHDDQVEAILALIRADRTLGSTTATPSPIFQNGEGSAGITVETGMPKESGTGTVHIWSLIDTEAMEIITA